MSHSLGRDPATDELLSSSSLEVRMMIPVVCFMEAIIAFEAEKKRNRLFVEDLQKQARQLKRNRVDSRVKSLIDLLDQSVVELSEVHNDAQSRFHQMMDQLQKTAEFIELTSSILGKSMANRVVDDPTDNLILASILDHAGSQASNSVTRAFLSENHRDFEGKPYPKLALEAAGVKYFAQASKFLQWHRSQTESQIIE